MNATTFPQKASLSLSEAAQKAIDAYEDRFESTLERSSFTGPIDEEMVALRQALQSRRLFLYSRIEEITREFGGRRLDGKWVIDESQLCLMVSKCIEESHGPSSASSKGNASSDASQSPPMELTQRQLREFASYAALDARSSSSYLPQSVEQAKVFQPHAWVITAMQNAVKADRADRKRHNRSAFDAIVHSSKRGYGFSMEEHVMREIAVQAAWSASSVVNAPDYLPRSPVEAGGFTVSSWVLSAMDKAVKHDRNCTAQADQKKKSTSTNSQQGSQVSP